MEDEQMTNMQIIGALIVVAYIALLWLIAGIAGFNKLDSDAPATPKRRKEDGHA
jgi:uncharacterized membrane protein YphA (DoxX/SURF4 family)